MNKELIQNLKVFGLIWAGCIAFFFMLSAFPNPSHIMIIIPGQLMVGSLIWIVYKCLVAAFKKEKKTDKDNYPYNKHK